jgi:hypothetical protein
MAPEKPKTIDAIGTLGMDGVVLDPNPLAPDMPMASLVLAQNATHDPKAGYAAALRKRAGLVKFNQENAGGPILGGAPMAVAGTGGAPATGGGGTTGSSSGAGEGTGAPGGTTDGTGTGNTGDSGSGGAGAGLFNGGTTIFGGARLLMIALDTNTLADGYGWYITSKKMQDVALVQTSPGPPGATENHFEAPGMFGRPFCITDDGWLYYSGALTETATGQTPTIRRTNGAVDQLVYTITALANPNDAAVVMCMAYGNGKVYVGVRDSVYNASSVGRLFQISHTSLTATQLGGTITGKFPNCMTFDSDRLFWGTGLDSTATAGAAVYTWSEAVGSGSSGVLAVTLGAPFIRTMLATNGVLWIGCLTDTLGDGDSLLVAQPQDATLGGIASSPNVAAPPAGADGTDYSDLYASSVQNYTGFQSFALFNGAVYASWYEPTVQAVILKCTLGASGVGAFQVMDKVWDDGGASGKRVPLQLFVDDGVLYAVGTRGQSTANVFMYTEDGITWSNNLASSIFGPNNPSTGFPRPIFFGVEQ